MCNVLKKGHKSLRNHHSPDSKGNEEVKDGPWGMGGKGWVKWRQISRLANMPDNAGAIRSPDRVGNAGVWDVPMWSAFGVELWFLWKGYRRGAWRCVEEQDCRYWWLLQTDGLRMVDGICGRCELCNWLLSNCRVIRWLLLIALYCFFFLQKKEGSIKITRFLACELNARRGLESCRKMVDISSNSIEIGP